MSRRPTRAQLADRARQDWLCERAEAELEACEYCDAAEGVTCRNPLTGLPLYGLPAHGVRIAARARRVRALV